MKCCRSKAHWFCGLRLHTRFSIFHSLSLKTTEIKHKTRSRYIHIQNWTRGINYENNTAHEAYLLSYLHTLSSHSCLLPSVPQRADIAGFLPHIPFASSAVHLLHRTPDTCVRLTADTELGPSFGARPSGGNTVNNHNRFRFFGEVYCSLYVSKKTNNTQPGVCRQDNNHKGSLINLLF